MAGKQPKQKESSSERALARIGSERFARFQEKLLPLEKEFLSDVADQRETQRLQRGMASNDYATSFSGAKQQAATSLTPGSNALGLAELGTATGAATGLGKAQLESDLNKQYATDLQGLVAQGSGQAGQAISGLSSAAEAAGQRARQEAKLALQSRQSNQQLALGGLGLGTALGGTEQGRDFLKDAAGKIIGTGIGALGLMSPTGNIE